MASASFACGAEADNRRRVGHRKSIWMTHCARNDRREEGSAIVSREKSWEEDQERPAADARAAATNDPSNGKSGSRVNTPIKGAVNPDASPRDSSICSIRELIVAA